MNGRTDKKPVVAPAPHDEPENVPVAAAASENRIPWMRIAAGLAMVVALAAVYAVLSESGSLETLTDGAALRRHERTHR